MVYRQKLSNRELEIVQKIANGYTDREIAQMLAISNTTVSTHRKKILRKLKVRNTALLIRYVIEQKLVR